MSRISLAAGFFGHLSGDEMRRILVIGAAGCLALTVSSQSVGQTPKDCRIASVHRTATGLNVRFAAARTLQIADQKGRSRVVVTPPQTPSGEPGTDASYAVRAVTAELGEVLSSHNSPEDSCAMTVMTRDGRIGIEAEASFNVPGAPGGSKKAFIPAGPHSTSPQTSPTGYVCWIARVEEAGVGVNVFFSTPREVSVANFDHHTGRTIWADPASPIESSGDKEAVPVGAVSAVIGETLSHSSAADDKCTMKVTSRAGKIGIETADWFMAAE